jgi:hypothetical protein
MSISDDIKMLREHYNKRLEWNMAAIDRLESDIQGLWNEYFLKYNYVNSHIRLVEIEKSFVILKSAIDYFRSSSLILEKRLDDLNNQEYALINNKKETLN